MKKTLLHLLFAVSFAANLSAQIVNIPDANFKKELIKNTAINTNGDDEIQVSEAAAYSGSIAVVAKKIKDLTGIESFVKITVLHCYSNQLTNLDLSKNIALTTLYCYSNQLTSLNLSKNIALTTV